MALDNTIATTKQQAFADFMGTPGVKRMINEMMSSKDGSRFMTSIVSAVASNTTGLQKCDYKSILSAAMIGESLKLSPSPQMGHFWIIPYGNTAQFQMGYKGYIQLALRSGHYKDIDAICIKQGEFKGLDASTGKPIFGFVQDPDQRDSLPVIGYLAYFEMTNGFLKKVYWTKKSMEAHARKYSKAYGSFWGKNEDGFNGQSIKTVLKQLLSRWGLLSVEMQTAMESELEDAQVDMTEGKTSDPLEKAKDNFFDVTNTATAAEVNPVTDAEGRLTIDGKPV